MVHLVCPLFRGLSSFGVSFIRGFTVVNCKLQVFIVQGEIHIYGSHSELADKNIDTTQLLGLIHQKSDERDEFAYKADSDEGE